MPDPRRYPQTDLGWVRRDAEEDRTAAMVLDLVTALARRSGRGSPDPEPATIRYSIDYDRLVEGHTRPAQLGLRFDP